MIVAVRKPDVVDGRRMGVLVYRDRIAPRSEAHFLRRQYAAFQRLVPQWVGCRIDDGLADLDAKPLILGRAGLLGMWDRVRFKQFGVLPCEPDLRACKPGIIHAQFGRGGALALPIARALGIPLVVTFHGGDATKKKHFSAGIPPTVFHRRLDSLKREAALFVCVSEFIYDTLAARGFPREKLRVIRLGVEPSRLEAGEQPDTTQQVAFVGRFVEKKGITYLLDAARILATRGKPIRFLLIGDGPLKSRLERQVRDLPNVAFAGWLPNSEVRDRVRTSAVLCAPSVPSETGDTDGLPTVILEAMADGIPVIGSRVAGIGEAVVHGRNGLLVAPRDAEALAHAIESVVANDRRRHEMGSAARTWIQQHFDVQQQSRLLEQTLLEIAQEHEARV